MVASWRTLCKAPGFSVADTEIEVHLHDVRTHRVAVEEKDDCYVLTAVVLRRAARERAGVPAVRLWEMNRSLNLVGLRVDSKGRLMGEAWIPKLGVSPQEFQLVTKNLAVECDRYEFMLTGKDVE